MSDHSEMSQVSRGLLKLPRVESVDKVQHNRAVVSDYLQFDLLREDLSKLPALFACLRLP